MGLPEASPLKGWQVGKLAQEVRTRSHASLHMAALGMWAQSCGLLVGVGGQGLWATFQNRCDHSCFIDGKTEVQETGSLCSSTT